MPLINFDELHRLVRALENLKRPDAPSSGALAAQSGEDLYYTLCVTVGTCGPAAALARARALLASRCELGTAA
ncbi:DUF5133 domain-containing protein [Streptacidiphilus sp. PB12-B1b]|uniref:DUF5133 domain-containing protein n=1 Tax=Streptacidiphilus sp. PB12-B1b TaxID=2705012 RepID=UPI0015F85639|nr:DUF5133 domain-containing protein [Streptacidiphilus sp. PB12-B1b]QMU76770.1 DUF5133 domain-containing protein [Streptacidiphilus sp. PB12-B1b]